MRLEAIQKQADVEWEEDAIINELTQHFIKELKLKDQEATDELKEEIAGSLDLNKGRWSSWGNAGEFKADGTEYDLVESEDEAERIALESVEQDMESEPETYNKDFMVHYISLTPTDIRIMAGKEGDAAQESIEDDIKHNPGDNNVPEEYHDDPEQWDGFADKVEELVAEKTDEVAQMLQDDPVNYFVHELGAYTEEELLKQTWISFDHKQAAHDAVRADGWAMTLSLYDNNYEETANGLIYFRAA